MLRQPEVPVAEQGEPLFVVEYGRILAGPLAVVASHAYVVVLVEAALQVLELLVEHLLRAEHVGLVEVYLLGEHLGAHAPGVALYGVVGILVAYVVRTHEQRLR